MSERFAMASLTGGQMNALVKLVGSATQAKKVLRGELKLFVADPTAILSTPTTEILVDYGRFPNLPQKGWGIDEHETYQYAKAKWYETPPQLYKGESEKTVEEVLENVRVYGGRMPVTVFDYLLELNDSSKIPEDWKGKRVFFLGTIFRDLSTDIRYVACLGWDDGGAYPYRKYVSLDTEWTSNDYSAYFFSGGW